MTTPHATCPPSIPPDTAPGGKPWDEVEAMAIIDAGKNHRGALLPLLHALQDTFGYIDDGAVGLLAQALNLSQADVLGVISFYHDFRRRPPGNRLIKLCRADACQSMGSTELHAHITATLGAGIGETTADGSFTLAEVYCLGNCGAAPAVLIGERICGRVTPARFDKLIAQVRAAEEEAGV